jgi:hypothetical protein
MNARRARKFLRAGKLTAALCRTHHLRDVPRASRLAVMQDHIRTVMRRWSGQIPS